MTLFKKLYRSFFWRVQYVLRYCRQIIARYLLRQLPFPGIIHIENTNACNAHCIMCPREKMTREQGVMDMTLFKRLVDECAGNAVLEELHLHGFGEPLLDPLLPERVRYAKEKGIKKTYIVSNASQLTPAMATALIEAGLDAIKVSFYGVTKEVYEQVHRQLNFEEVEANVMNLFQERARQQRSNPSICLQFLPQDNNEHEARRFQDTWQTMLDPACDDWLSEFTLHNYTTGRQYNTVSVVETRRSCQLPDSTMHIFWNGDVVPCCFDYNGGLVLTEVRTQSISDAWNSKPVCFLRAVHRMAQFKKIPFCDRCDQLFPQQSWWKRLRDYFSSQPVEGKYMTVSADERSRREKSVLL